MSLIRFLIILAVGTMLSWLAWVMALITLDPFSNPVVGPMLFYASAWLAIIGTMTLLGFFIRHWLEKTGLPFHQVATSLRQGTLLSSGLILLLMLQRTQYLNVWTFILVMLLVVGTEIFFLAGQTPRGVNHNPAS
jgi:hypothetical protein